MKRKFTILLISLVVCISGALCISAYPQTSGLSPVQLMALIAGGAFPENLSYDVKSRGISFEPDDNFISLANTAGANPIVISALRNSKRISPPSSRTLSEQALLQRLNSAEKYRAIGARNAGCKGSLCRTYNSRSDSFLLPFA